MSIKNILKLLLNIIKGENKSRVDYIYGAPLPSPFTKEEEKEVLKRLAMGDTKARDELIEHNLRLVVYIAKKFDGSVPDTSDLISIGAMGLIKAVNNYNPDKNIKLATYASRCIENEILMHLRKVSRRKCEISLDEPVNTDWEGNELMLSDIIGTDPDSVSMEIEKKSEIELLYKSMEKLSAKERKILYLRYGLDGEEEKTQKEIADMLGISQSYISRLEKKVLLKLRDDLNKFIN